MCGTGGYWTEDPFLKREVIEWSGSIWRWWEPTLRMTSQRALVLACLGSEDVLLPPCGQRELWNIQAIPEDT